MRTLFLTFILSSALAPAATIFLGAYPDVLLVFDEVKGTVIDRIKLSTGTPTSIRPSMDQKKIYVTTNDHSGIEIVDVATLKVISHFVLNTPTTHYRFTGGAPDPTNRFFYTVSQEMDRLADRYRINKPKYTVIDLEQQKITKTVDLAPEDEEGNSRPVFGRGNFEVSPDGKYIYQFRDSVIILNANDFKVVDRIELAKPDDLPEMEQIGFGGLLDSIAEPGKHISLFNSTDPIVHNRVFGIARFDLTNRQVDFRPIGPSPPGMAGGLQVAPDKKTAYTVVTTGNLGRRECEFWTFDLASNSRTQTASFPCRTRFNFAISGDGRKLYIYGAGYEIDVYDATTLKYERTWNLENDVTMAVAPMLVLP